MRGPTVVEHDHRFGAVRVLISGVKQRTVEHLGDGVAWGIGVDAAGALADEFTEVAQLVVFAVQFVALAVGGDTDNRAVPGEGIGHLARELPNQVGAGAVERRNEENVARVPGNRAVVTKSWIAAGLLGEVNVLVGVRTSELVNVGGGAGVGVKGSTVDPVARHHIIHDGDRVTDFVAVVIPGEDAGRVAGGAQGGPE